MLWSQGFPYCTYKIAAHSDAKYASMKRVHVVIIKIPTVGSENCIAWQSSNLDTEVASE